MNRIEVNAHLSNKNRKHPLAHMKVSPINLARTQLLLGISTNGTFNCKGIFHTNRAVLRSFAGMSSNEEESNELTSKSPSARKSAWDSLWQDGITPWDLGKPTPVLISELKSHWDTAESSSPKDNTSKKKKKTTFRSLIPGCGAAYDLLTLAQHHEKWMTTSPGTIPPNSALVVGLDLSDTSLERASDVVASSIAKDKDNLTLQQTRVNLMNGDFFNDTSDWKVVRSFGSEHEVQQLQEGDQQTFDFIFDYTFFCALAPSMRSNWAHRIAELLTPGTGRLLTVIFPIIPTADRSDGPPFPVTVEDYRAVLEPNGIVMDERTAGEDGAARVHPDTVGPRVGRELVCWWVRNPDSNLDNRQKKKHKSETE